MIQARTARVRLQPRNRFDLSNSCASVRLPFAATRRGGPRIKMPAQREWIRGSLAIRVPCPLWYLCALTLSPVATHVGSCQSSR
jgi:hypothetical protein